jgi:dTDP-4-amino-4,6-dideoxygalactose transaminase
MTAAPKKTAAPAAAPLQPLRRFLDFAPPSVGRLEADYVVEALASGWLTTGPRTELFERVMAEHLGTASALAVNSCTAALHLGLKVLGVGPGQAVVTTPLTFASTAHAAVHLGARPLLADVSHDTGNLDPDSVARLLDEDCDPGPDGRPVHRATGLTVSVLLPVHYGGHPADLPRLWEVAVRHRLHVLEDAAHALGSTLGGLPVGHPGHRPEAAAALGLHSLAAFSFYATKNITTGEGGLLTSSDPDHLERARRLSAYGISDARRIWGRYAPKGTWIYDVVEPGYKYNFTDLQAALGLAQMERLPELLFERARRASVWRERLDPLRAMVEPPSIRPGAGHSWHLFALRIRPDALDIGRDEIISALRDLNIGTSVMFIPLHYHSYYQQALGHPEGAFPVAEDFFRREISLPVSPGTPLEDIEAAASLVAGLLARHAKT